jgi:hypothetical protein
MGGSKMRFVEFQPHDEALCSGHPKLTVTNHILQRSAHNVDKEIVDLFVKSIKYDILKPNSFCVPDNSNSSEDHGFTADDSPDIFICLIHVGFSIELPSSCKLKWARFIIKINNITMVEDTTAEIISLLPRIVDHEMDLNGLIRIDSTGILWREQVPKDSTGPMGSTFTPRVLGFHPDPRLACWDFQPNNEKQPAKTVRLAMSVRKHSSQRFILDQNLYLHLEDSAIGSLALECSGGIASIQIA